MLWYFSQIGRASSRLLNAILGGEGDCTFSAYSWQLQENGARHASRLYGRIRVVIVDGLTNEGHCRDAAGATPVRPARARHLCRGALLHRPDWRAVHGNARCVLQRLAS